MDERIKIGDILYWARINHRCRIFDVFELKVRTVYTDCFVGVDNASKQAFILGYDECDKTVFCNRADALAVVLREQSFIGDEIQEVSETDECEY